ncbi:hypothetical protein DYB34_011277 [Aphanomyces astaci]|uniref:Uncharacterized protein n=1 Tax=Aphanomyces astaci TaxID=112090 RepID=A0A3R6ZDN2_APHAT|nr:hypothetical protein DYB34_011277 [Aphanomyces astaci]
MAAVASAASFRVASAPVDRHLTAEQQYRAEKFVGLLYRGAAQEQGPTRRLKEEGENDVVAAGAAPEEENRHLAAQQDKESEVRGATRPQRRLSFHDAAAPVDRHLAAEQRFQELKHVGILSRGAAQEEGTHSLTDYLFVPVLPSAHIQNEEGDIRAGQKPTGGFFELPAEFRSANKHTSKQPNAHSAEGPPKRTARAPKSSGAATDTHELPHGASVGVDSVILDGPSRRLAGQQQHAGQDLLTVGLDTFRDFLFVPVLPYSIGADEAKAEPTPSDDAGAVGIQQVGHESPSD